MSVGIETFGRISCFCRLPIYEAAFVVSLELRSKPVGEVALLDNDDSADEASSMSVVMDEAIDSRALSGLRCRLLSDANLGCRSALRDINNGSF
jgi:hypothetical protein